MPININDYHPKWSLISKMIRFTRAGNKCEWCGVPNGKVVRRYDNGSKSTVAPKIQQSWNWGQIRAYNDKCHKRNGFRITRIVLTVAHLDQNKDNNRFENLAALCQKCHLGHDAQQHARNRKYGRYHKRHQLDLFE